MNLHLAHSHATTARLAVVSLMAIPASDWFACVFLYI
jgi:hypothetical protein